MFVDAEETGRLDELRVKKLKIESKCVMQVKEVLNQMNLVWGVKTVFYEKMVSTDHTIADIKYLLFKDGNVKEGDFVIHLASMPIADTGMTNMLKLSRV